MSDPRRSAVSNRSRSAPAPEVGTNLVVLRGVVARPPELRVLASGVEALHLDVVVAGIDGPSETAPVVWSDPPARAERLDEGLEVVVVGRVRRRFFRVGATTATRTEVCADTVVPVSAAATVRAAVGAAIGSLTDR